MYSNTSKKYINLLMNVNKKYTYDYMENGKYISPILRRAYSSIISKLNDKHNPFNDKNIIQFAKENYLFEKKDALYKPEGFEEKQKYSKIFSIINKSLKFLLFIIGPVKFSNLTRLFVYLSSPRQVDGFWKFKNYKEDK
jgi:hypothetical protein